MNSISKVVSPLGRLIKAGALGGLALGVYRALRGPQRPPVTGQANWPPLVPPAPKPKRTAPVATESGPTAPQGFAAVDTVETSEATAQLWAAPIDGQCPDGYPIKGNAQSGIFHVPGGISYDRTIPEKCYRTAEDAVADGFRQSKR